MGGGALQQERGQYSARQSGRQSGQPARHPRRPRNTGGGKAVFFVLAAGLCAALLTLAVQHANRAADAARSTAPAAPVQSASAAAPAADAWQLRLVNGTHLLPADFTVETRDIKGYDARAFDVRAADALEQMLDAAEADGCKLYLVSSYRSMERQTALFERKTQYFLQQGLTQTEAEEKASQWVARPGASEHTLGLAADIVSADWYDTNSDLTAAFDQTPHFAWLKGHCAAYGFILRYPQGKENITGVTYEPWHYRYVGIEAAQTIMAKGLALEEYLA